MIPLILLIIILIAYEALLLCMWPFLALAMVYWVFQVALTVPPRPDLPVHYANLTCQEKQQWGPDISFAELVDKSHMNTSFMLSYLNTDAANYSQNVLHEMLHDSGSPGLLFLVMPLLFACAWACGARNHPGKVCVTVWLGIFFVSCHFGDIPLLLWQTDMLMLFPTYISAFVAFPLLEKMEMGHMDWWIAACIPFQGRIIPVTVPMVCAYACKTMLDLKGLRGAATEKLFENLGEEPWGWIQVLMEFIDAGTDIMAAWDMLNVENLMIGTIYSATTVISIASATCCLMLQIRKQTIDDGTRQTIDDGTRQRLMGVSLFEGTMQFCITSFCVFGSGHQPIDEFVFYSMVGNVISGLKGLIQWCCPASGSKTPGGAYSKVVQTT